MTQQINKVRDFEVMKYVTRALLSFSIGFVFLSCLITLLSGAIEAHGFNYFSVMSTIFILLFSIPTITGIAVYLKLKKENVLKHLKREIILIAATISSLSILSLLTTYFD
ncbi:hypothetical protein [Flavobacterium pedocola]